MSTNIKQLPIIKENKRTFLHSDCTIFLGKKHLEEPAFGLDKLPLSVSWLAICIYE
jgi:hypothetical protein